MNDKTKPTELDNLASQAAATVTPPLGEGVTELDAAAAAGQGPAPAITNAQAIQGALVAARDVFCLFTKLESPRQTLTDAAVQQLSELWGAVCDKRQINLAGYLGDYAAEIAAGIATLSIAMSVRAGVVAELAARKPAEPLATDTAPAPAAGSGGDGSAE